MGGYIRMDKDLAQDPRVAALGDVLGQIWNQLEPWQQQALQRLAAVGVLYAIWSHCDIYLSRGDVLNSSVTHLQNVTGVPVLLLSKIPREWLRVVNENVLEFPGYSAKNELIVRDKRRKQDRNRKRRQRAKERANSHAGRHADVTRDQTVSQSLSQSHLREELPYPSSRSAPGGSSPPGKRASASRRTAARAPLGAGAAAAAAPRQNDGNTLAEHVKKAARKLPTREEEERTRLREINRRRNEAEAICKRLEADKGK